MNERMQGGLLEAIRTVARQRDRFEQTRMMRGLANRMRFMLRMTHADMLAAFERAGVERGLMEELLYAVDGNEDAQY